MDADISDPVGRNAFTLDMPSRNLVTKDPGVFFFFCRKEMNAMFVGHACLPTQRKLRECFLLRVVKSKPKKPKQPIRMK